MDKQTLERVIIDEKMMDKTKAAFMERLENRRANEVQIIEENKVLSPTINF